MKKSFNTISNTTEDQLKKGCLIPLLALAIALLISVLVICLLNFKGSRSSEYSDSCELSEMKAYHSDKGLLTEENGLIIIKR